MLFLVDHKCSSFSSQDNSQYGGALAHWSSEVKDTAGDETSVQLMIAAKKLMHVLNAICVFIYIYE
jgi:hypothetical protein